MAEPKDKMDTPKEKAKTEAALGLTAEDKEKYGKKLQEEMKKPVRPPYDPNKPETFKKGGSVKSSASKRADGCCVKGKTRGRMV